MDLTDANQPIDAHPCGIGNGRQGSRRAAGAHASPSGHERVVIKCVATSASGVQTSAGPPACSVQANDSGGDGSIIDSIMPDIIGLGLDSTDIDRVETIIEQWGDRFVHRVFTDGEIAYAQGVTGRPFILPADSPPRKPR